MGALANAYALIPFYHSLCLGKGNCRTCTRNEDCPSFSIASRDLFHEQELLRQVSPANHLLSIIRITSDKILYDPEEFQETILDKLPSSRRQTVITVLGYYAEALRAEREGCLAKANRQRVELAQSH